MLKALEMHKSKIKWSGLSGFIRILFLGILVIILSGIVYFNIVVPISPPDVGRQEITELERENPSENYYTIGNNWLRKNSLGLWEMYVEGSPFEIGVISGKLSKELIRIQENAFVEQINELIPSRFYLRFLKHLIGWFNRDLDKHIREEYLEEIYGIYLSASTEFDYISDNYERMLNYHAAHDIGHALKDLALVGCTSFAVNMHQPDSNMFIGRNFDFYINDKFAQNKIVAFINPDSGYKFMYITWASMIGVVSGMNEHGLTVTINAAKSDVPTKSATPISILAREILQYATTVDEAKAIAEKRKTFVSESILIGSAYDQSATIIEKSPEKMGVFSTEDDYLVCSNHFQSEVFADDENNLMNIETSPSKYREDRCKQLILNIDSPGYYEVARILRDHRGMDNKNIGIGNEKTMAQMISHHSVIFQPEKGLAWVSTHPYQLGSYLAYDINKVFSENQDFESGNILNQPPLTIPYDPFLNTGEFRAYLLYKELQASVTKQTDMNERIPDEKQVIDKMIQSNPEYFKGYMVAGDYYFSFKEMALAKIFYTIALSKELEDTSVENIIKNKLKQIEKSNLN